MSDTPYIEYNKESFSDIEMLKRTKEYFNWANLRRTVRDFSEEEIPLEIMENIILTASTAPSGAHKQPWTFCLISNKGIKSELRKLAEEEEFKSYHGRMSEEWLNDLAPFGTNWQKPFIESAPWIIVVMKRIYEEENGIKKNNYYVSESVGLACGILLSAIHNAGLVALTHTPSPMNFILKALNRPENERPFLLIPVGKPSIKTMVPDLKRKNKNEIIEYYL
jgi:iodotyrosine deiodinase